MQEWLKEFCHKRDYHYHYGVKKNEEYGKAFNRSKVTVNWSRTELNRPHRVFDAMGCRTCLLTRALPTVEGEERFTGVDYAEFREYTELADQIDGLLQSGVWQNIADSGYATVHKYHTWPVRAKQLRQIISEELGL